MFINQLGLNLLSPLKNKILDIDPLFPSDDEIASFLLNLNSNGIELFAQDCRN